MAIPAPCLATGHAGRIAPRLPRDMRGLSQALRAEGRPHGIKVTARIRGGMRTPFLLDRFPDIDVGTLQDPLNVAHAIRFVLTQPAETVIAELTVLPVRETSWP